MGDFGALRFGPFVLAVVALLALAPSALAAPKPKPKVQSVAVDPTTAIQGQAVKTTVEVANPSRRRTDAATLVTRIKPAAGGIPGRAIGSTEIPALKGRASASLTLEIKVPTDTAPRAYSFIACRGHEGSTLKCGKSKATTDLRVVEPADLRITPDSRSFGTHATGTTSPKQTFTVRNAGGAPTGALATTLAGTNANQFAKSADSCGASLAPGATCTLDVAFAPTAVGAKSGTVDVDAAETSVKATLEGTGAAPANLTITPVDEDFGDAVIGSTTAATTFTVANTGGVPTGAITTSLAGTNADQFAKSADGCDGQTLGPGGTCTVNAAFAPGSSGAKTALLRAATTPGGAAEATLDGNGLTPANLTISPTSHDFGEVVAGEPGPTQTFTITNTGQAATGALVVAMTADSSGGFTFGTDTCPTVPDSLPGGQSCTVEVFMDPPADTTGLKLGTVGANSSPGGNAEANLVGTVVAPAKLEVSPISIDFGNVFRGTASRTEKVTVTNTGGQPSGVGGFSFGGPNGDQFEIVTDCADPLAPGASCEGEIRFTPDASAVGNQASTAGISAVPGGNVFVGLGGNAATTPSNLQVSLTAAGSPAPGAYSNTAIGTFPGTPILGGVPLRAWIRNSGGADTYVSNSPVPIVKNSADVATLASSTCPVLPFVNTTTLTFSSLKVAAGAECYIDFRVAPLAVAPFSATYTIEGNPGGAITVNVSGDGV